MHDLMTDIDWRTVNTERLLDASMARTTPAQKRAAHREEQGALA